MTPLSPDDPRIDQLLAELQGEVLADEPAASSSASSRADGDLRALRDAAEVATAALVADTALPASLQRRLAAAGLQFCAETMRHRGANAATSRRPAIHIDAHGVSGPAPEAAPRTRRAAGRLLPFLLGAAAGLIAYAAIDSDWQRRAGQQQVASEVPFAERRTQLLRAGTALWQQQWKPGPQAPAGQFSGDVVWSDERQEGYLLCRGLPRLDGDRQFQLWIVDAERDAEPVDGGLFEVPADADEAVVPIRAHLHIGKAAAFVITVERRGGVVVSRKQEVIALAGL